MRNKKIVFRQKNKFNNIQPRVTSFKCTSRFIFFLFFNRMKDEFVESIHHEYKKINTNILFLIYAIICIVSYNLSKSKRKQIIK